MNGSPAVTFSLYATPKAKVYEPPPSVIVKRCTTFAYCKIELDNIDSDCTCKGTGELKVQAIREPTSKIITIAPMSLFPVRKRGIQSVWRLAVIFLMLAGDYGSCIRVSEKEI